VEVHRFNLMPQCESLRVGQSFDELFGDSRVLTWQSTASLSRHPSLDRERYSAYKRALC
jgi:hypothetical protein